MEKEKTKKVKKTSKFKEYWRWPLIVLLTALCLSLSFGVASQYALSGAGIAVSIIVIVVFIIITILTDMIGVAVTVANLQPFRAMASKKVRGAKESIKLIKNAEKVASISADVLGDICSILSGTAGATLTVMFVSNQTNQFLTVLIASAVSAVIAALTIFGKAMGKKYAMTKSEKIVLILGKIASLFHFQKHLKKTKQKKEKDSQENDDKTEENHA